MILMIKQQGTESICKPSLCVDRRLSSLIIRVFDSDFREVPPGSRDRWLDWITSVGAIMKYTGPKKKLKFF